MEINEYLVKFFQIAKGIESVQLFPQTAELSNTEFRMLREICLEAEKDKNIISSELARRLGVTRSAISQIVTKLEKQGIVRRTASDNDKKIAYIQLSDNARTIFEAQCEQANALIEKVVNDYGEKRMDQLLTMFSDLAASFRKFKDTL